MSNEIELMKEISNKLSQLLVLTKLSNFKVIADTKKEIQKDPISRALLDLADGLLTSSQIQNGVIQQTHASQSTVKRRIAELVEKGGLISVRKGKEIYYENSGLYD